MPDMNQIGYAAPSKADAQDRPLRQHAALRRALRAEQLGLNHVAQCIERRTGSPCANTSSMDWHQRFRSSAICKAIFAITAAWFTFADFEAVSIFTVHQTWNEALPDVIVQDHVCATEMADS